MRKFSLIIKFHSASVYDFFSASHLSQHSLRQMPWSAAVTHWGRSSQGGTYSSRISGSDRAGSRTGTKKHWGFPIYWEHWSSDFFSL